MPRVQFSVSELVRQDWRVEMEIPQEVIDQGEDAMREFVNNSDGPRDYLEVEDSDVLEAMQDPEAFEVIEVKIKIETDDGPMIYNAIPTIDSLGHEVYEYADDGNGYAKTILRDNKNVTVVNIEEVK